MKNTQRMPTVTVDTKGQQAEGVIMTTGGVAAGMVLYLDHGVPMFEFNFFEDHTVVAGDKPLTDGMSTVTVDFSFEGTARGGTATVTLGVNVKEVAQGNMDGAVGYRFGLDTLGIGEYSGQPVTFDYKPPFKFTGEIDKGLPE